MLLKNQIINELHIRVYGSCRVSDQGTTLRASDLHNARADILNPFNLLLGIYYTYLAEIKHYFRSENKACEK